jgi:PAS domain S-box-containing protein
VCADEWFLRLKIPCKTPLNCQKIGRAKRGLIKKDIRLTMPNASADLLARAFNAAPNGFVLIDRAGLIVAANSELESMFGFAEGALLGQSVEILLPAALRESHRGLRDGFFEHPARRAMGGDRVLYARHFDGHEFPVEIGLNPLAGPHGPLVLASVVDISERLRMASDLRQANADLQEFTYVASHDLRSPLRGIADLVEWIQADLGEHSPAEVMRNLGRVTQRIQRMERLIDDLLSYAKAGQTAKENILIDLHRLVSGILEIQPLPAQFKIDTDLTLTPFTGAKVPLETVLRNLISNAIKHHDQPESGHITIQARENGSFCEISVIDNGPGIPSNAKDRVFKLFQALSPHARDKGNSGMGLAFAKRIVEAHGGRIELRSPAQENGRGALFCVKWPRFPRKNMDTKL